MSGFQDDNSKSDEKNAKFETEQTRTLAAHQIHSGLLVPETSSNGDLSVQEMMAFSQKIQADLSREVGDRYRIIEPIAEGGMAVIFRAEQVQLGREVAIKLMKSPERTEDVQRFETEAAIAAKLAHPNIVRVYDFGRLTNGHMYLVMELVSGETLKSYVLRNGALEPSIGVDLMRQITEALVEIHQNQVVHRDIKPTNIVLIERP
ncbi:MAG: serine/threonine-protein kinase, partial [Myxococcota bacterium]|nr:serine/threonine-protein kinase [Myxococcota bacterium]